MSYFLDTNICIYFLKGTYPNIVENLKRYEASEIKIPSIVKAELLTGAYKSKQKSDIIKNLEKFLLPFEITAFDDNASENYALIRSNLEKQGKIIGPNDLIIAATVLAYNGILVTNNEHEFSRVKDLKIENWTK